MTMTTTDNPYLVAALAAYEAGLSVLPPKEDGTKQPIEGGWSRFQHKRPGLSLIRAWYENGRTGVGAVMGGVSGDCGLFEFDDMTAYLAFMEAAKACGLGALVERIRRGYSERTPGNGIHWLVRCQTIGRNTKLARRLKTPEEMQHPQDRYKVLIETRANGGYAILAPSSGAVHPSGGAYEMLSGSFATIATITPAEWTELRRLAATFDECGATEDGDPDSTPRLPHPANQEGGRPGDDYIARSNWRAVLGPHGWKEVHEVNGVTHWRRPGKDFGISATTNYGGSDLLYVFTTSTAFAAERAYNRFSAYAVLNHDGDFAAAASALRRQGFGSAPVAPILDFSVPPSARASARTGTIDTETGEVIDESEPDAQEEPKRPFEIIDGPDFLLRPPQRWIVRQVIPEASFFCILGQPGSFKSFVALDLCLAVATGTAFQGQPVRQGSVLYVCAEGAGGFAARMRAWQKGRGIAIPRSFKVVPGTVPLTSPDAVRAFIQQVREQFPDETFTLVVFDTLSRSMPGGDENSPVDMTTAIASAGMVQQALACCTGVVHHGTKADGSIRGHSSLPGALDTIIRVMSEGGVVTVKSEKQKDGEPFPMLTLKPIIIDLDLPPDVAAGPDDNDDLVLIASRTSVILDPLDARERQRFEEERRRVKLTANQRAAAKALYKAAGAGGATWTEWWKATGWDWGDRERLRTVRISLLKRDLIREESPPEGGEERFFLSGILIRTLRRADKTPDAAETDDSE